MVYLIPPNETIYLSTSDKERCTSWVCCLVYTAILEADCMEYESFQVFEYLNYIYAEV